MVGAGEVASWNDVTTPRWPPPPPRSAQNRSGSCSALTLRTRRSAVTTCIEVTASQVSPIARVSTPTPPPRVSPAMPTVAHEPPAIARPRLPRLS